MSRWDRYIVCSHWNLRWILFRVSKKFRQIRRWFTLWFPKLEQDHCTALLDVPVVHFWRRCMAALGWRKRRLKGPTGYIYTNQHFTLIRTWVYFIPHLICVWFTCSNMPSALYTYIMLINRRKKNNEKKQKQKNKHKKPTLRCIKLAFRFHFDYSGYKIYDIYNSHPRWLYMYLDN